MAVEDFLSDTVDVTKDIRAWFLSLDVVTEYVADRVIDTLSVDSCDAPYIWYNMTGITPRETLEPDTSDFLLPDMFHFVFEVADTAINLALTRRVAAEIQLQAERHKICRPFGSLAVQAIFVEDVNHEYMSYTFNRTDDLEFTAMQVSIRPVGLIDLNSPDVIV